MITSVKNSWDISGAKPANIPAYNYVEISSNSYTQPNFFIEIDVVVSGFTYYDGSTFKRFRIYSNPVGKAMFYVDFLSSFFNSHYFHKHLPFLDVNGRRNFLITSNIEPPVRKCSLTIKEFYGTPPVQQDIAYHNFYFIYSSRHDIISMSNFIPQVNDKIFLHSSIYPFFIFREIATITIDTYFNNTLLANVLNITTTNLDNVFIQAFNNVYIPSLSSANKVIVLVEGNLYKYNLVKICGNNGVLAYWINDRGGLEHFYFPTYNITHNAKKNSLVTFPEYSTHDFDIAYLYSGYKTFGGQSEQGITVETDLIDDKDAEALATLVNSPYIYFHFLNEPKRYYEAIITDTNYITNNFIKNKYTTKTFNLKYKLNKV